MRDDATPAGLGRGPKAVSEGAEEIVAPAREPLAE